MDVSSTNLPLVIPFILAVISGTQIGPGAMQLAQIFLFKNSSLTANDHVYPTMALLVVE